MVPFESLGPGQSGRLVYQVMGKVGPIFNPTGIKYLPPDMVEAGSSALSASADIAAGLSGINLAVSAGTLALSAATLVSVQKLHKKFDGLTTSIGGIERKLDAISSTVKRIDIRVSETHLREALKHCLRRACTPDEISFVELSSLRDDIATITDAIEDPLLFNLGIRLSSDVRNNLSDLAQFLRGVRSVALRRHNLAVDGDGERVIPMNLVTDYWAPIEAESRATWALYQSLATVDQFSEVLQADVKKRFTFSGSSDASAYEALVNEKLRQPLFASFASIGVAPYTSNLPSEVFEGENPLELAENAGELLKSWLWTTDSGLLWRTNVELFAMSEGYDAIVDSMILKQIEGKPRALPDVIDVQCIVPSAEPPESCGSMPRQRDASYLAPAKLTAVNNAGVDQAGRADAGDALGQR